jgi:hypothetical protein
MTQYWFKPKRYGYGATPVTREGWAVTIAFTIVIAMSIVAMELLVGPADFTSWLIWAVLVAVPVLWFAGFSRRDTDGEWRWRWGGQSGTQTDGGQR